MVLWRPTRPYRKWKWSYSVVSDSSKPHGLQPTRLLHPWHFPGKSTGVGCHCLLRDLIELTPKKDVLFIIGNWNAKVGTKEFGLECTEWGRAKANRVLPRERAGHSKHPLLTMQKKILHKDITRWSTPKSDWLYSLQAKMETLYTVSKNKAGSWRAQIMNSLLQNSNSNWRK